MGYTCKQYKAMQEASGLEVGDKVKVLRSAPDEDLGWTNGWTSSMNKAIGNIYTITSMGSYGVTFKEITHSYPFQVLELVSKKLDFEPFTIKLRTLKEFEMMKSIMHVKNKVSECSFFELYWTPNGEDVKDFMENVMEELEDHRKGWSKYNKGE